LIRFELLIEALNEIRNHRGAGIADRELDASPLKIKLAADEWGRTDYAGLKA